MLILDPTSLTLPTLRQLWQGGECRLDEASGRVEQVWFPGVHSDVGGGYATCGLSDTTLLWMTTEATERGLVFDERLLQVYVECGKAAELNDSLSRMFRVLNVLSEARMKVRGTGRGFVHGWRRLDPPADPPKNERAVGVKIASTAATRFRTDEAYHHPNVDEFATQTQDFSGRSREVVGLPRSQSGAGVRPRA